MAETGRSRRRAAEAQCDWLLSHGSLNVMVAPAAEVNVGMVAVSLSSPVRVGWPVRLGTGLVVKPRLRSSRGFGKRGLTTLYPLIQRSAMLA